MLRITAINRKVTVITNSVSAVKQLYVIVLSVDSVQFKAAKLIDLEANSVSAKDDNSVIQSNAVQCWFSSVQ